MRTRLQYTEPIEQYYKRLWNISEAAVRDLVRIYKLNNIFWRYRDFSKWLKDCYRFEITYSQFKGFEKYYKYYFKRKKLKLPKNMIVNKQFYT